MIGIGTSLLFDRRAGKGGSPIPPFNDAMVDAWFMSGLSNVDKPSSIRGVKGNEMQLKNFAYSLSSGFGKYEVDFNSWKKQNTNINVTSSSITITGVLEINTLITYKNEISKEWKVEITGLPASESIFYRYYEDSDKYKQYEMNKNGVYSLPPSKVFGAIAFICNSNGLDKLTNLTITQLPSAYEGALVFDGMDDYGICTGLPIMTDYTVICRRIILTKPYYYYTVASKSKVANEGAFVFEIIQDQIYNHCHSFGANNRIDLYNGEISWQTKNSYNGNTIEASNRKDSDHLFIGRLRDTTRGFCLQGVIYYFALYNKSLTPEEIEIEKERLNEEWLKRKTE